MALEKPLDCLAFDDFKHFFFLSAVGSIKNDKNI